MKRNLLKIEIEAKIKRTSKNKQQELQDTLRTKTREQHHERQRLVQIKRKKEARDASNLGAQLTKVAS